VKKRVITERAKIGITSDLQHQSWNSVTLEQDPNKKAEKFQALVTSIVDKWCPLKSIRTPSEKAPITTPLITKLRRAKLRAYRKAANHGNTLVNC
jgi:hypothetical protein